MSNTTITLTLPLDANDVAILNSIIRTPINLVDPEPAPAPSHEMSALRWKEAVKECYKIIRNTEAIDARSVATGLDRHIILRSMILDAIRPSFGPQPTHPEPGPTPQPETQATTL